MDIRNGTIEDVYKLNLCLSCGTCVGVCPEEALTMQESRNGIYKPLLEKKKCTNCKLCMREGKGTSVLITRSELGEHLLMEAVKAGVIEIKTISIDDVVKGQAIHEKIILLDKYFGISKILGDGNPTYNIQFVNEERNHKLLALLALIDLSICRLFAMPIINKTSKYLPIYIIKSVNRFRDKILRMTLRSEESENLFYKKLVVGN